MTECTDIRSQRCLSVRLLAALIAVLLLGLVAPSGSALADGDPASDVLATQPLFLPQDAGIALPRQGQLTALLRTAASSGYQVRVAIIATRSDLGSVTELWRQPQTYARFLDQELSLVYRGPLLVVMPDGFGVAGGAGAGGAGAGGAGAGGAGVGGVGAGGAGVGGAGGAGGATGPSTLAGVRIPAGPGGLGVAALTAVQRLAAAAGHPLPLPPAVATASGAHSSDALPILAFAIGVALIVLAWVASLRARPPRLARRRSVGS